MRVDVQDDVVFAAVVDDALVAVLDGVLVLLVEDEGDVLLHLLLHVLLDLGHHFRRRLVVDEHDLVVAVLLPDHCFQHRAVGFHLVVADHRHAQREFLVSVDPELSVVPVLLCLKRQFILGFFKQIVRKIEFIF